MLAFSPLVVPGASWPLGMQTKLLAGKLSTGLHVCLTAVGCDLQGLDRKGFGKHRYKVNVPDAHGTPWEGSHSHGLDNEAQGTLCSSPLLGTQMAGDL